MVTSNYTNNHGKKATPDNETCHDRSLTPVPPLPEGEGYGSSLSEFHVKSEYELELEYLKAIEALADEIDCPVEEVSSMFVSVLDNLKSSARIQDYLIVLTNKTVRDMLHEQSRSHSSKARKSKSAKFESTM